MHEFGIAKVKKPLQYIAEFNRKPHKGSSIGIYAFNDLYPSALSNHNQKLNRILFFGIDQLDSESNPYDFNQFMILKREIRLNNENYTLGFDNKGRIYFFTNEPRQLVQQLFLELKSGKDKKQLLLELFKIFKNEYVNVKQRRNIIIYTTLKDAPSSDVEKLKEIINSHVKQEIDMFQLFEAR